MGIQVEMISLKEAKKMKASYTLDTTLNNRSLQSDRYFLRKKLNMSDIRKKKTKLGGFVTDVDHSDIIVESNLTEIGKEFLDSIGYDERKRESPSKRDNLKTKNSEWIRENFFKNIRLNLRDLNEK